MTHMFDRILYHLKINTKNYEQTYHQQDKTVQDKTVLSHRENTQ